MKKHTAALFVLFLFCSVSLFSQTDKTTLAFNKSIELEKKQDYNSALIAMFEIGDTTTYEIVVRIAWLNYKADHKKRSEYYYQKAITLMPNAIEPLYGYCYPAYALEDHNTVFTYDKKILEIDPNNKMILSNIAHLYYYNQDYNNAMTYFEKVVSLYPFEYETNHMLGWTYFKLGKFAEAENAFSIALLYAPRDPSATEGMNSIKDKVNNNGKLFDSFTRSYELSDLQDYKGAIATLKNIYDKGNYYINLRLGWLNYMAGSQLEAVNYYKIAAELKPTAIEPKLGLAIPTELLGNKNDTRVQYEAVLSIDPNHTYAHYKLGMMDYDKKDYKNALTHFEKIVKLYPCDGDGLLMMGWTNFQLGKMEESKTYFTKTLWESPGNKSAIQGLNAKAAEPVKSTPTNQGIKKTL